MTLTAKDADKVKKLKTALQTCDCVVIGAGAGLSTAAGYTYGGERFDRYFSDFKKKYGFDNMYAGGFTRFASPEEQWAFWSRNIYINRYLPPPKPVYEMLLQLVQGKDYFVLTTNVDHCFQRAGFDKKRLLYTQGDYGLWQCSVPCHNKTYDNEETVRKMMETQSHMRVPTELVPHCPVCGEPMGMNLRADNTFVEDEGWHAAANRYTDFVRTRSGQNILFLELGVGYNTPGIIKLPFWQMTAANKNAVYACVNLGDTAVPPEIADRAICIDADIAEVIAQLADN